ncbi:Uncharacterised protein [Streptococcus pneumoniae]|nr:Uncharacterised protein [Streptococcus pneumoniae]
MRAGLDVSFTWVMAATLGTRHADPKIVDAVRHVPGAGPRSGPGPAPAV